MPIYLQRIFIASAMFLTVVGCAKPQTARNGAVATAVATPCCLTPFPRPTVWPSYLAENYGKLGHPRLTAHQAALIRKTLALLVKPCQVALLRYAFPANDISEVVLFFQPTTTSEEPHVLWTRNLVYREGLAVAEPYDNEPIPKGQGTASEVRQQSCTPGNP
jgi:hypothetical protein